MHEKLGVTEEQTVPVWQEAFAKYNQTLKGLRKSGFLFDVEEYWDDIRAGAEDFLSPDPQASTPLIRTAHALPTREAQTLPFPMPASPSFNHTHCHQITAYPSTKDLEDKTGRYKEDVASLSNSIRAKRKLSGE